MEYSEREGLRTEEKEKIGNVKKMRPFIANLTYGRKIYLSELFSTVGSNDERKNLIKAQLSLKKLIVVNSLEN